MYEIDENKFDEVEIYVYHFKTSSLFLILFFLVSVAGGRSRLHLIDLGNSERSKASGGIPLSGVGNILLAIFNGQKHLPYKENKLTHLLKVIVGTHFNIVRIIFFSSINP